MVHIVGCVRMATTPSLKMWRNVKNVMMINSLYMRDPPITGSVSMVGDSNTNNVFYCPKPLGGT